MATIGSARIDENGKISGGKAGDQTGKEVSTQAYYEHSKGWYAYRAHDGKKAEALAKAMLDACNNDNIGYDQSGRLDLFQKLQKFGTMKDIKEPTEADCSSLVRACILEAYGVDIGNQNTSTLPKALERSGLFDKFAPTAETVCTGDVLVTKTKGHTAIVTEGAQRVTSQKVIDVSQYQGSIDWAKVRKQDVKVAVLKVMKKDGSVEPSFERNYSEATAQGIFLSVYNYSCAKTTKEAQKDAKRVLEIIKGKNIPGGVWLDLEDRSIADAPLKDIVKAYKSIINGAGYDFGVYTGLSFYNAHLKGIDAPLWIARYPSSEAMALSQNPPDTKRPNVGEIAWQYTSRGIVGGISTYTDISLLYAEISTENPKTPNSKADESTEAYQEPSKTLKKGSKGEDVKWVQAKLVEHGAVLEIDGDFGKLTEKAVKAFQENRNIERDGIVGSVTREELKK